MKPKILKEILQREINSLEVLECAKDPSRDFSRTRKLPLNVLITTMLHMEGQSVGNELLSMFPKASETPSSAAFVQQRSKLNAGVFDVLFHSFVRATEAVKAPKTFHGMRLLAVDGSDIHIPTDLSNEKTLLNISKRQRCHSGMASEHLPKMALGAETDIGRNNTDVRVGIHQQILSCLDALRNDIFFQPDSLNLFEYCREIAW